MNSESSSSIPRRDFIILPLISLLTVLLMTGVSEFVSRRIWVEKLSDSCIYQDPTRGEWRRPNCSTMMKNIEGPWIRYDTNDCGFRGTGACGIKPPGVLRVVIIGTSVAFGLYVPYEHYFANVAASQLRDLWGHPVEFQNMGDLGYDWSNEDIVQQQQQLLALKPDAVLYVLMPSDLNHMDHSQGAGAQQDDPDSASMKRPWWTWTDVRVKTRESRFLFMAQHFLLRDEKFFYMHTRIMPIPSMFPGSQRRPLWSAGSNRWIDWSVGLQNACRLRESQCICSRCPIAWKLR
jgi:hypothetical protein